MTTLLLGCVAVAVAVGMLLWPRARASDAAADLLGGSGRGTRSPVPAPVVLITEDVAAGMVLLGLALQSGCGVVEAIEEVAATSGGAVKHDLSMVAAALRWGVPEREAWACAHPAWARAGTALRLATRAGVAPSGMLTAGAADLRASELAQLEIDAARVAVRMVLPLGLAFLPAFCLTSVVPVILALARQLLEE